MRLMTCACSMHESLAYGEEATEAAHSGKDGTQSTAEANLEALASSLGDRKVDLQFVPGDQVIVVDGDLRNLEVRPDQICRNFD